MRSSPFAVAVVIPLVSTLVAGCTGPGRDSLENNELIPTVTASPAQTEPCLVVAEPPGLPAWEVNEALPIDGVDVTHNQTELLVESGDGRCDPEPASASTDPCHLVVGPYEEMREIHLWRHADVFFEQEVAAGARRILSENLDGYTVDGEGFHWRVLSVEFDDPGATRTSPAWAAINACDNLTSDKLQTGIVSLSQGEEPFLAATIQGTTIYIVETWIAAEDDRLDDTKTGLPPADAVRMLMVWLKDQVRHIPPGPNGQAE